MEWRRVRARSFLSYTRADLYFPLQPELSSPESQMQSDVCVSSRAVSAPVISLEAPTSWQLRSHSPGGDQSGTREWGFSLSIPRENRITTKLLRF